MRAPLLVSSRSASIVGALCAVAFVVAPAAPASAQPKKPPAAKPDGKNNEAKKLFDDGAAAYTQGNYEAAIDAWTKAYDISKKPLIFESIANAYERLGDAKKAREFLSKWRDVAPKDEQDLLDARIKNLDARVTRDDEIEAARKAEAEKTKKADEERERQRKAGGGPGGSTTSIPGVVLLGVGGAAVAVGVTLDIIAGIRRPAVDTACATTPTGQICKASSRDAISSSNTLALAGDILWIAGAAAAAGGAVLIITHKAPKDSAPPTATWIAPAGAGVLVGHSF
ncbi:MAG: tetratricopeptide repeat protein [Byssovorax sp.]